MDKEKQFSDWYNDILEKTQLIDMRYPVKGMPVYMPYGYGLLSNCFKKLEQKLEEEDHKQTLFPLLIPEEFLEREKKHVKGFEDQVYWTQEGERKLSIRPTSETAMYPMFSLWIRSWRDLPLKIHQTTCVYRCETKATRPLIRGREVYWNEGHTAHKNHEEAAEHVKTITRLYSDWFTEWLGVPHIILKRPEYDKFPGADYSIAFDTLMPDGKSLQIATVHHLGENFAKAFDINYEDEDGTKKPVSQTSFGPSMRAMAAVVAIHGDEKGLILPPNVAPTQAIIIPILFEKTKTNVLEEAQKLLKELLKAGIRAELDERELHPGTKYYHWEERGVPLRIELGPKDLEKNKVVLVRRDTGEKRQTDRGKTGQEITKTLSEIQENLKNRAKKWLDSRILEAKNLEELGKKVDKNCFVKIHWCQKNECAEQVEKNLLAEIRGTSLDEKNKGNCTLCGKPGSPEAYVAKAY